MNTNMYGWLLGMASVLVPLAAPAATDCHGTVTNALLYGDGSLNVRGSWRGDFTVLCNTNGTFGGIPGEICLSWYATAIKSIETGKSANVYYAATYSCTALPTYWSSPVPTYFGLQNT